MKSIKRGKRPVNVKVDNALLKRALGYEYEETTKTMSIEQGTPVVKEVKVVTKQVIPDVGAQAFWLKNRDPRNWKDKHDITSGDEPITFRIIPAKPNKE